MWGGSFLGQEEKLLVKNNYVWHPYFSVCRLMGWSLNWLKVNLLQTRWGWLSFHTSFSLFSNIILSRDSLCHTDGLWQGALHAELCLCRVPPPTRVGENTECFVCEIIYTCIHHTSSYLFLYNTVPTIMCKPTQSEGKCNNVGMLCE